MKNNKELLRVISIILNTNKIFKSYKNILDNSQDDASSLELKKMKSTI